MSGAPEVQVCPRCFEPDCDAVGECKPKRCGECGSFDHPARECTEADRFWAEYSYKLTDIPARGER